MKTHEEEPYSDDAEDPREIIYRMAIRNLSLTAQRLDKMIRSLPEGTALPPGINLCGDDGFSLTSEIEPIALKRPVEVSFYSSPAVLDFANQFGLNTSYRLDVGLHTDTDDEESFRRLRERIDAGEEIGDTTFLVDPNGNHLKLSFLPNGEIGNREMIVPFEDGAFVQSKMTPGCVELAGSVLNSLLSRVNSLQPQTSINT